MQFYNWDTISIFEGWYSFNSISVTNASSWSFPYQPRTSLLIKTCVHQEKKMIYIIYIKHNIIIIHEEGVHLMSPEM